MDKKKLKASIKYRTPEIILGFSVVAFGATSLVVIKQLINSNDVRLAIDSMNSIRVLEEIAGDLWKDLDTGLKYVVTPAE